MRTELLRSVILSLLLLTGLQLYAQDQHWVCVNQAGYNLNAPKRFTVPTAMTGDLEFYITEAGKENLLYRGVVKNGTGDFTAFKPANNTERYTIHVKGGKLQPGISYPFSVGPYLLEKEGLKPSVWFMNDSRSITGTHHSAYGGCPWRDGTYYSYEIPSVIWMYLSNPTVYEAMPSTISYDSLKRMVLDTGFRMTKEPNDETALAAARKYFTTIEKPKGDHIPDIIMDLHWGIGYYMVNPETKDPSKGETLPRQLHPQTLAQFAFFLHAYPWLSRWFSHDFYEKVLTFTRQQWQPRGLLEIRREIGDSKGRHAPGFSVLPNLLMYEVAQREKLPEANTYLQAASRQVNWIIDSLQLEDPVVTKGQRMSEHMLMTGLAMYYQHNKGAVPAALQRKIDQWADIVIALSGNAWDFRRYDMQANWTVPEYNEVGNVAGFPASALLAAACMKNEEKRQRLEQIAFAHFDNLYGRNPLNVHAAHHPEKGFSDISKGYPKGYHDSVCARLELCRGSISCLPGTEMYPFDPNGKDRHLEGWIAHNTAWNVSLAVLNWYDNRPLSLTRSKNGLKVRWQAPVNYDYNRQDTLPLTLYVNGTRKGIIPAPEAGKNSQEFETVIPAAFKKGDRIKVAYGYGFLEKSIEMTF
ncbi:hypothetical protein [Chitinophaga tropicalis]|uniref:Cellulase Ig-like domain-containing protein n=1 Tax=Chitinophaga tropicalis TaxID=2683588 RepID=A0A7K1U0R2_9BACT|nr:hypothetical protein [Chitinophaga tropicalis]MVT07933.1 hypothetical protein [Chitinophaga tropicalis]